LVSILLLEDDELFALSLVDYIEEFSDYKITHVNSGNKFLEEIYNDRFDLYLLDINVPDINGIDLLKEIRESQNETPAIFLTSYKDKETLTNGFLSGADDFLTKPFDMDELILRINSNLKRIKKQSIIEIGKVLINLDTKLVTKDSKEVKVGHKVIDLFELFYQNNHSVVTKDMIINRLWNTTEEHSEGSIRVYVNSLKKLFSDENLFKIDNIKNIGYKIEY